jgi:hypothetical protein
LWNIPFKGWVRSGKITLRHIFWNNCFSTGSDHYGFWILLKGELLSLRCCASCCFATLLLCKQFYCLLKIVSSPRWFWMSQNNLNWHVLLRTKIRDSSVCIVTACGLESLTVGFILPPPKKKTEFYPIIIPRPDLRLSGILTDPLPVLFCLAYSGRDPATSNAFVFHSNSPTPRVLWSGTNLSPGRNFAFAPRKVFKVAEYNIILLYLQRSNTNINTQYAVRLG